MNMKVERHFDNNENFRRILFIYLFIKKTELRIYIYTFDAEEVREMEADDLGPTRPTL